MPMLLQYSLPPEKIVMQGVPRQLCYHDAACDAASTTIGLCSRGVHKFEP